MKYIVRAEENSHYDDEEARWTIGEYDDAEEALAAAKRVIDEDLTASYKPGATADHLFSQYCTFGIDTFIVGGDPACKFSGRDYARQRVREICSGKVP